VESSSRLDVKINNSSDYRNNPVGFDGKRKCGEGYGVQFGLFLISLGK
jgi:hypothetical protein